MENNDLDHLAVLKNTVIGLVEDIKENIFNTPDCSQELLFISILIKKVCKEKLMQKVIEKVLPHANEIEKRNTDYFIENLFIFEGLDSERSKFYANKFRNGEISDGDMEVIWEFMATIVALAEDYKKVK